MDPKGLRVTQNAYFSLIRHTKQLLSVTFCDATAGIGISKVRQTADDRWTTDRLEGWKSYLDNTEGFDFFHLSILC